MRAPLAPPRLSLPRNVDADAHAVETSCETVRPESRIRRLSSATSSAFDELVVDGGDRVLPDQLLVRDLRARGSASIGPMSRCVSLNHARANASASSSGFSMKRREIGP